jgi:uncharacterized membrane protein
MFHRHHWSPTLVPAAVLSRLASAVLDQQAGIVLFYLTAQELVAVAVRSFKVSFAEHASNLVTPAKRDVVN